MYPEVRTLPGLLGQDGRQAIGVWHGDVDKCRRYRQQKVKQTQEESMATITLHGTPTETVGQIPANGATAPPFSLTGTNLKAVTNHEYLGKTVVLNIFPSIDTAVCAASVRHFNSEAANCANTVVLCISADLPFAHKRFCEVEGLERVVPLSVFRSPEFGQAYGVTISGGPLAGLLARAVVVIDGQGRVAYSQLVPEIGDDPDFAAALKAVATISA
jgi:thiol peroxidase